MFQIMIDIELTFNLKMPQGLFTQGLFTQGLFTQGNN